MAIILLPTALDPRAPMPAPERPATVVWMVVALIAMQLLVSRLVDLDQRMHWGLVSDHAFRVVTFTTSTWSLYSDPALFNPWQLWSYAMVHDSWAAAILNLLVLAVVGRAVERWIGALSFLGATLTLAPLAAVIHLLLAGRDDTVLTGADGLAAGVLGMAWALFPNATTRWGVAYFAVVALGYVPLFRLALPWIALCFLAATGLLRWQDAPAIHLAGDAGALLAGVVLGLAGRRIQGNPEPPPRGT
jgi:membrane associated rhomboid family serine protease